MHYKQIFRMAPSGAIERPWRNREHQFVLGDPKQGSVKHHDEFAVKVDNYGEALELVERGFSIRMSDGRNPASLVSPASLTLLDEPTKSLDDLWHYTSPVPPFAKELLLKELKKSLLAESLAIAYIANIDMARSFSGIDLDDEPGVHECDAENIDLGRFRVTAVIDRAFDYAFGSYPSFYLSEEDVDELEIFLERASSAPTNRFDNPMHRDDSALRMTAEMAYARWQLREGSALTVKRMAFLARMTENAVRNSLSKEQIKLQHGLVPFDEALRWLEGRQNFLPQRQAERIAANYTGWALNQLRREPVAQALGEILNGYENPEIKAAASSLAATIEVALARKKLPPALLLRDFARTLGLLIDVFVTESTTEFERLLGQTA